MNSKQAVLKSPNKPAPQSAASTTPAAEVFEYWFRPAHWFPRRRWPASVQNEYRVGVKKILDAKKKGSSGGKV